MTKPTSFPRARQTWEVTDGCEVQIQYLFTAPITFTGTGRLIAGERVCIMAGTAESEPTLVRFLPVRYDELHDSLVPPNIRETPRYKNYTLSVKADCFHEHFRLIQDAASDEGCDHG